MKKNLKFFGGKIWFNLHSFSAKVLVSLSLNFPPKIINTASRAKRILNLHQFLFRNTEKEKVSNFLSNEIFHRLNNIFRNIMDIISLQKMMYTSI